MALCRAASRQFSKINRGGFVAFTDVDWMGSTTTKSLNRLCCLDRREECSIQCFVVAELEV